MDKYSKKLERDNKLIACPESLFTADGRKVCITSWTPSMKIDDAVRVTLEGFIVESEGENDEATST